MTLQEIITPTYAEQTMMALNACHRTFHVSGPYSSSNFIGGIGAILQLVSSKDFHYTPEIKELVGVHKPKFVKLKKAEIAEQVSYALEAGMISDFQAGYIRELYNIKSPKGANNSPAQAV